MSLPNQISEAEVRNLIMEQKFNCFDIQKAEEFLLGGLSPRVSKRQRA